MKQELKQDAKPLPMKRQEVAVAVKEFFSAVEIEVPPSKNIVCSLAS